jgi:plastocyanin
MTRLIALLVACLALFVAGCGSDDAEQTVSDAAATATTATDEALDQAEEAVQDAEDAVDGATLAVAADPGGDLKYTEDALTAKAGTVAVAFTNDASLPHDFVVERDGTEVGRTEIVTGGKTATTLDLEAGEYTYYCSVGDHRDKGMEGTLTVE